MLFGDEKRFKKGYTAHAVDKQIHAVHSPGTDEMIGPGSYYNTNAAQERNGWSRKSFSRRQPMTPPNKSGSVFGRNDSYTTGTMTHYGAISAPMSPKDVLSSPGPGHYEKNAFPFNSSYSRISPNTSLSPTGRPLSASRGLPRNASFTSGGSVGGLSQQSVSMSTSKRFLFDQSACLKDGVLFLSSENNAKETGPGYYNTNVDTLHKHSHNIRAQGKSPRGSPMSPGNGGDFSPRYSGRVSSSSPRSASSPRMRF